MRLLRLLAIPVLISCCACAAQTSLKDATDPALASHMTTPVDVTYSDGSKSSGTGFFFIVLGPKDPAKTDPQWRSIVKTYVITNRHVIQPNKLDSLDAFTFSLRRPAKNGTDWYPVVIKKQDLLKRLHVIPDSPIDVAAVEVGDLINALIMSSLKKGEPPFESYQGVSSENFPGAGSPMSVESGDDVVVVGYPRLFADDYNKLPILKSGILITPWSLKYQGQDEFLIDYKGFHGSSGSLVISKPTNLAFMNGSLVLSQQKQFLFLGVYSGEPYVPGEIRDTDDSIVQEKIRVDVGQVWYYYTVQQTIDSPVISK